MKSFSILRTNAGLTTNAKIVIDKNYNLSIDSIDSNDTLSSSRYKNFKINENTLYDEALPIYYKDTPSNIAFDIKYRDDVDVMSDTLDYQFDDLYNYGARNIIDNKNFKEEYEYFAPLYMNPNKMPTNFIIFRCDDSGIKRLTKNNFKNEIINKLKTVQVYDLTPNTKVGKWINNNFKENVYFPNTPLEIDFRSLEFSKWNGIDYKNGGYVSKSKFLGDYFEEEKEIFELEKDIFDSYKENGVVFPNILNFSFLFDDNPSNSELERKWSLNTYYGFYLNSLENKYSLSPYKSSILRDDIIIGDGNLIYSPNNPKNPFIKEWTEDEPFYIEYKGEYYLISRYTVQEDEEIRQVQSEGYVDELYQDKIVYKYKIISDISLKGKEQYINSNYGNITDNNELELSNNNELNDSFKLSDVWLIKIDGLYHNIIKAGDKLKINTDYSFEIGDNYFEYKVGGEVKRINTKVDFETPPLSFDIFRLDFTDIKDFDTKIVDTDYSKYEYEYVDKITNTEESKMYFENPLSVNNPKDEEDFIYKNEVVNIPVSSEYTANYETFKIKDGELSNIWRINPEYCRWGYQNSLSNSDKPYLLNNSLLFEDFNRTTDVFYKNQNRQRRNLDYFYTLNSSSTEYLHHSLHIEGYNYNNTLETRFDFNEYSYLSNNYNDYFAEIFERKQYFNNSKLVKNVKKYSHFNKGDDVIPNTTLFRGLEFKIYDVDSIVKNNSDGIENINLSSSNQFEDYKFSILLTESYSNLNWDIIETWQMDKEYQPNQLVIFDDIIYKCKTKNKITKPTLDNSDVRSAPYNSDDWDLNIDNTVFWHPINGSDVENNINRIPKYVYNYNRFYYIKNNDSDIDFWNPLGKKVGNINVSYDKDIVLFKGQYYISTITNNNYRPDNRKGYWEKINKPNNTLWEEVQLWNPSSSYLPNELVYHNDILYISSETDTIDIGDEPGVSILWDEVYTFNARKNINENYKIFVLNNSYYSLQSNRSGQKQLSNGINIYINKKWKNILVNIDISDNTLINIKNTDRDDLYKDIYNILTASNLYKAINDISDKSGFIDYLKYKIIDENGLLKTYDFENNIKKIPHLLVCSFPDEISIKNNSLIKNTAETPNIKISLKLNGGNINNIDNINWYNGTPLAFNIVNNEKEPKVYKNYNNIKNIQYIPIYRYSGYYMPVFYEIDLFDKSYTTDDDGNYIFDTSLTDFGIMKERKFRKVNKNGSILKLKDSKDYKSIYPMIDEFGYSFKDFMIFKSTWDKDYHYETVLNKERFKDKRKEDISVDNIGQPNGVKIENEKKYRL